MFDLNNIPFDVYGVLGAVLTSIAGYVGSVIAKYVKEKHFGVIVEQLVGYAEQKIGSGNGDQKFRLAAQKIGDACAKAHIKVDGDKIEKAIEASVLKLNASLTNAYATTPAQTEEPVTGNSEPSDNVPDSTTAAPAQKPAAPIIPDSAKVAPLTIADLKKIFAEK